jgi:hypothetical protein
MQHPTVTIDVLDPPTPPFATAPQACLPSPAEVSAAAPASDADLMQHAAWRLQAQASCLDLLLLELATRGLDPQSKFESID